jgi:hypothetical protein
VVILLRALPQADRHLTAVSSLGSLHKQLTAGTRSGILPPVKLPMPERWLVVVQVELGRASVLGILSMQGRLVDVIPLSPPHLVALFVIRTSLQYQLSW